MNKKRRSIVQKNFRDNYNGYCGFYFGDYYTRVNWEWIGLDTLNDDLHYYIG